MDYNYIPKYVDENINYQAGEKVNHSDYNRNLNLLNVAVANNTDALKRILNNGGAPVLNALALNGAQLKRHRDVILQDNEDQVPSSKAVYEHVKLLSDSADARFNNVGNILDNQDTEMFKINKRIQVVNSLIEQQGGRFDEIEEDYAHITDTMRGGATGQVLAKQSSNPLDYTWTNLLPGPKGDPGNDGYTPIKGVDYIDGVDGYTPVKGVDYFDGEDGVDGYTPVKGVDYFDGIDGIDGADGYTPIKNVDYFDGEDGAPGAPGADGADGADGVGVPSGGTTGQLLSKINNTDYNTAWIDPPKLNKGILPSGNGDNAYWQSLEEGTYFADTSTIISGGSGKPSTWGVVFIYKYGNSETVVLWNTQSEGYMYRMSMNALTVLNSTKWKAIIDTGNLLDKTYPIGSIYMSVNSTNPSTLFGGTWVAWGTGRVPVGIDTSQTEFDTVEEIGGEKTHTLSTAEMPSHRHYASDNHDYTYMVQTGSVNLYNYETSDSGSGIFALRGASSFTVTEPFTNGSTGGDAAHNNLQPYITCYMWKRTA